MILGIYILSAAAILTAIEPIIDGDGHSGGALQCWYSETSHQRIAKIAEDQISNHGFSSGLYLYGSAKTNHGTVSGIHIVNNNWSAYNGDNRMWIHRQHDVSGSTHEDGGSYVHECNRYNPNAPDSILMQRRFSYNLLHDEFGNIGIGMLPNDIDEAADSVGNNHIYTHPWAKLSLYSSPNYPAFGILPEKLGTMLVTNSMEYDGTNLFWTNVNKQRKMLSFYSVNYLGIGNIVVTVILGLIIYFKK